MEQLDNTLFALSHSSRRAIIARLSEDGPTRITEIATRFDASLNTVSKHLKVLEQAGLVQRTKAGRDHLITFDPTPLKEVVRWIDAYATFWAQHLDRLEHFFAVKNEGKPE